MATYDTARYWTTHNSYEGGGRGSLPAQLAKRVRCVELDFWDNDYEHFDDFRLGHLKPGHAVALGDGTPGQNPKTVLLEDWLKKIADWSAAHGRAAPITIVLDAKSDLTDNEGTGDIEDLNLKLENAFGSALFTRAEYDEATQWPAVSDLRGRVLCVLSGDSNTRLSYRYSFGEKPAIAADANGNVVIAYRSRAGDMRYWSGTAKARVKRIEWVRKGTYAFSADTVSEPSLTMTDDGFVISVHRIGPRPSMAGPALLEYRVGELQTNSRISWGESSTFADGLEPSLAMASANKVQEIHRTVSRKSLRLSVGTLNRSKKRVDWNGTQATQGPQFPRETADWNGHQLRSLVNASNMILCSFDGTQTAVQYRQVAFVELQSEESPGELVDARFYGASAGSKDLIAKQRRLGLAARGWWFKKKSRTKPPSPPQENFAATDEPFDAEDPWYAAYMAQGGQTEV